MTALLKWVAQELISINFRLWLLEVWLQRCLNISSCLLFYYIYFSLCVRFDLWSTIEGCWNILPCVLFYYIYFSLYVRFDLCSTLALGNTGYWEINFGLYQLVDLISNVLEIHLIFWFVLFTYMASDSWLCICVGIFSSTKIVSLRVFYISSND